MRRADRLLLIVQILRRHRQPVSAGAIAAELEVSLRTIYRDMVALESTGVPIRGEAGIGYVLEDGYDLPPLMFTETELEALVLGARMVDSRADPTLARAARDVIAKVEAVLPPSLAEQLMDVPLYAPNYEQMPDTAFDVGDLRTALREGLVIAIRYRALDGARSSRDIWPVHVSFFRDATVLMGWCTMREDFRAFRLDGIEQLTVTEKRVPERRAALFARWRKSAFPNAKGPFRPPGTR
ncbi:MAG: YafY family protein [Pseudomonadota bacterium]